MGALDRNYLRFIYPKIEFDTVADIVYLKYAELGRGFVTELVSSESGYALFQKTGVIAFLRETHLLPDSKIDRIEKVATDNIDYIYKAVAHIRVSNRLPELVDDEMGFVTDFISKPLSERIEICLSQGTPQLLRAILTTIQRGADKDLLRYQHRFYQTKLVEVMSKLKKKEFKDEYQITGEWREDLLLLQFYFRS